MLTGEGSKQVYSANSLGRVEQSRFASVRGNSDHGEHITVTRSDWYGDVLEVPRDHCKAHWRGMLGDVWLSPLI